MGITWLGAAAIAVLVITGAAGYRRGFIKEVLSFFFVFLALACAWVIHPYINDFLTENTPVYEKIQESCQNFIDDSINKTGSSGNSDEQEENGENSSAQNSEDSLLENLGLPQILTGSIRANNTEEAYSYLAVDTFSDYVSGYLTGVIVNNLSYILAYLIARIVIRLIFAVLNTIAQLPVLRTVNRMTGGAVGIARGVLFLWIALLLLTVFCNTEIGRNGLNMVENDTFLDWMYRYDIFINLLSDWI